MAWMACLVPQLPCREVRQVVKGEEHSTDPPLLVREYEVACSPDLWVLSQLCLIPVPRKTRESL